MQTFQGDENYDFIWNENYSTEIYFDGAYDFIDRIFMLMTMDDGCCINNLIFWEHTWVIKILYEIVATFAPLYWCKNEWNPRARNHEKERSRLKTEIATIRKKSEAPMKSSFVFPLIFWLQFKEADGLL